MWRCAADAAGSIVTCSLGRLANGASSGFTLVTQLLHALEPGAELVNTARVSSSAQDPDLRNNVATAVVRNPGVRPGPTTTGAALPFTGMSQLALLNLVLVLVAAGTAIGTFARRSSGGMLR